MNCMFKNPFKIKIFILLLASAASCKRVVETRNECMAFPLNLNNYWVYKNTHDGGGVSYDTLKVLDEKVINGLAYFNLSSWGTIRNVSCTQFAMHRQGGDVLVTENKSRENIVLYERAAQRDGSNVIFGERWVSIPGKVRIQNRDCYRFEMTFFDLGGYQVYRDVFYFSKEIGFIRVDIYYQRHAGLPPQIVKDLESFSLLN